MPWNEVSVMDQRREFIRLALAEGMFPMANKGINSSTVYQPSKIGLKRLDKYVKEDGDLIKNYVNNFSRIITTPHILAETSNISIS